MKTREQRRRHGLRLLLSNGPPPTAPPALQVLPKGTSAQESCPRPLEHCVGSAPPPRPPLSRGPSVNPPSSLSFHPSSLFPDGPELEQFSTEFS